MSFDSLIYLIFLPAVFLAHRICPQRLRWAVLLLASLVFYASWNLPLTLLLVAVIGLSYAAGLLMARTERRTHRLLTLILTLALCLGLLLYFKYFHFLAGVLESLFRRSWKLWEIILPVGISFYTFQAMSYVIDVYRDSARVEKHLGYFALYISFFPQLVAGPIERAEQLLPQLRANAPASREDLRMGLRLLLSGFFRKFVIADFCAPFVKSIFAAEAPDGSAVFLGMFLFGLQIYNDFAGYSEIARGSARILGIRLMRNFDRPYLSQGFREFWRRWHVSLGSWFRDYVYVPLGGSRKGLLRQISVTLLVFALSGLWHGANWTFLVWGLFHGAALAAETLLLEKSSPKPKARWLRVLSCVLTFLLVNFSWIFFRAESLPHAFMMISRLFSGWNIGEGAALAGLGILDIFWLLFSLLQSFLLDRLSREEEKMPRDMVLVYLALSVMFAWMIRLGQGAESAFIYFQF